ncbi:hypothetical protein PROFUN_10954 [Planoprotostelium fungivorum]|uniref:Uncharacterized protein n=1 Tax=Planoprotostelium fungivorum TaxID=1890364 RepID=A0A2P6NBT2_9EUKA|nr:hypothetical protein PROFUN_10954 [Planoprotostelium fungivorum]
MSLYIESNESCEYVKLQSPDEKMSETELWVILNMPFSASPILDPLQRLESGPSPSSLAAFGQFSTSSTSFEPFHPPELRDR